MVEAMPVGTKGTESVKEGEPKFLGAPGKVNGGGSPNADSFDSVRNGTVCGKSLGVGTSDVHNVGESSMWEELIDEVRMSREELMDVKRRDFVRLRFNELVHMVFTGKR